MLEDGAREMGHQHRPYRPRMPEEEVRRMMGSMASSERIDGSLLGIILEDYETFQKIAIG